MFIDYMLHYFTDCQEINSSYHCTVGLGDTNVFPGFPLDDQETN